MTRIFAYARHPFGDKDGTEMAAQRLTIRNYCERHALSLAEMFVDEAETLDMPWLDRPAGRQLAARLESGDHVLIIGESLGMSARSLLAVVKDWRARGIVLRILDFVGYGPDGISTEGRIGDVLVVALEFYVMCKTKFHSAAVVRDLQERKRQGQRHTRHAGYGYRWSRGRRVPNPAEQAVVGQIVESREAGNSWREIAVQLLHGRVSTADGQEWSPARVRRAYLAEMQRRAVEAS